MNRPIDSMRRPTAGRAYTLVELLIVLAIMAISVAIVVPHGTKSNQQIRAEQSCQDMAQAIRVAMHEAALLGRTTRFTLDMNTRSFRLEAEETDGPGHFKPMEGFAGPARTIDARLGLSDSKGFSQPQPDTYRLVFDPAESRPRAVLSLLSDGLVYEIHVDRKLVTLEKQRPAP